MTNHKTLGNLEIYPHDVGVMNWYEATKACRELGDGWRLPTQDELNVMCINKKSLGGFSTYVYWSSSEVDADLAWYQSFNSRSQLNGTKTLTTYVRPVRDTPNETTTRDLPTG